MRKQLGLSLVEMMITVAIASILITVGAPGISDILKKNRVVADVNNLSTATRVARFTAIDEAVSVTLCPTVNYSTCTNDWAQAKMVFIDADASGSRANNEPIIASADPLAKSNTISGITETLIFNPDGSVNQGAALTICPGSGNEKLASALIISLYGRVAIATDSDDDDIREDAEGSNLVCT